MERNSEKLREKIYKTLNICLVISHMGKYGKIIENLKCQAEVWIYKK